MKIQCPECGAGYQVPDEKILGKRVRVTCKKCGAKIVLGGELVNTGVPNDPRPRDPVDVHTTAPGAESQAIESKSPEEAPSVASMSPQYPRHRDPLIFLGAVVLLILILGAGYVVFKGKALPSFKVSGNPIVSILRLFGEGAAYDACDAFVQKNEALFAPLGGDIRLSLIRQEVKSVNRGKTARLIVGAKGTKTFGQIYFQLRKDGDVWRVTAASLKVGGETYQNVYPPSKSKKGGKI